jgi:carbamoyltransferase
MASPRAPSRKAAIVTADSWGDDCNATISIVESGQIKEIHRTAMCNLARIYRWMTLLLGMKPNEHEYKVMGLAPYAKDYIRDPAYKIFKETLVVDGLDFKWKQKPTDMYFYFRERFEGIRFDGIAGGVQLWLEEMLCQWITNILSHTGTDVLYFSGGLSLNVKANKTVAELPIISDLHIPPSGGDESLAMGAAFVLSTELGETPKPLQNAYLGYEPSEEEARLGAEQFRNHPDYEVIDDWNSDQLAELLAQGKVLARCVGRMEFGARALGNRSILCDPSKPENLNLINQKIKFRDFWMPFTPSILQERAADYLINPKNLQASYMTIAFDSTPLGRKDIRAAIHPADFTVRPQVVTQELNPGYYALIKAFESKTGIGALLNTSLNLHGDPIVCNVVDSINTLIKSGLDGVILPGLLILRRDRNTNAR